MLDIVFFTDELGRGGAETQLARIAISLSKRGWKVGILSMFNERPIIVGLLTLGYATLGMLFVVAGLLVGSKRPFATQTQNIAGGAMAGAIAATMIALLPAIMSVVTLRFIFLALDKTLLEEGVYLIKGDVFPELTGSEQMMHLPVPKSMLAMEVSLGGRIEGFLVFDNFSDPEAFSHSDLRKLARVREHAISAISKARMTKGSRNSE